VAKSNLLMLHNIPTDCRLQLHCSKSLNSYMFFTSLNTCMLYRLLLMQVRCAVAKAGQVRPHQNLLHCVCTQWLTQTEATELKGPTWHTNYWLKIFYSDRIRILVQQNTECIRMRKMTWKDKMCWLLCYCCIKTYN